MQIFKTEQDIIDYKQCSDILWLEECVNYLYEARITDRSLAVIFEVNSRNQIVVKTPYLVTQRKNVEKIVLQLEVLWNSLFLWILLEKDA